MPKNISNFTYNLFWFNLNHTVPQQLAPRIISGEESDGGVQSVRNAGHSMSNSGNVNFRFADLSNNQNQTSDIFCLKFMWNNCPNSDLICKKLLTNS